MPDPSVAAEGKLKEEEREVKLPGKTNKELMPHMLEALMDVPIDLDTMLPLLLEAPSSDHGSPASISNLSSRQHVPLLKVLRPAGLPSPGQMLPAS